MYLVWLRSLVQFMSVHMQANAIRAGGEAASLRRSPGARESNGLRGEPMYCSPPYLIHTYIHIHTYIRMLNTDMAEEDAFGQELRLRRRELRHMEHEDVLSFIQTQVEMGEF